MMWLGESCPPAFPQVLGLEEEPASVPLFESLLPISLGTCVRAKSTFRAGARTEARGG